MMTNTRMSAREMQQMVGCSVSYRGDHEARIVSARWDMQRVEIRWRDAAGEYTAIVRPSEIK